MCSSLFMKIKNYTHIFSCSWIMRVYNGNLNKNSNYIMDVSFIAGWKSWYSQWFLLFDNHYKWWIKWEKKTQCRENSKIKYKMVEREAESMQETHFIRLYSVFVCFFFVCLIVYWYIIASVQLEEFEGTKEVMRICK
jgi:hypothetical protein